MGPDEFCKAVTGLHKENRLGGSPDLVQASIQLYAQLPMARLAVIQYFNNYIFEPAVADYVSDKQKDIMDIEDDCQSLRFLQQGLTKLVTELYDEHATPICTWSIKLLGKLAHKYGGFIENQNNKCEKLWIDCDAARALLSLAAVGFWRKDHYGQNDECILTLFETYVNHSPAFDWVIARLATAFNLPLTARVLQCGLRAYWRNANAPNTLNPMVAILDQLAQWPSNNIEEAIADLLQWNYKNEVSGAQTGPLVVPYLLTLAVMSDTMLPFIYKNLMLIFTSVPRLKTVKEQSAMWGNMDVTYNSLVNRMAQLLLQVKTCPFQLLNSLVEKATNNKFAFQVLLQTVYELERAGRQTSLRYPLLKHLVEQGAYKAICNFAVSPDKEKCSAALAIRFLVILCREDSSLFPQIVHYMLYYTTDQARLNIVVRFVEVTMLSQGTEPMPHKWGVVEALNNTFLASREAPCIYTVFWRNVNTLLRWENTGDSSFFKQKHFTNAVTHHLTHILAFCEKILDQKLKTIDKYMHKKCQYNRRLSNTILSHKLIKQRSILFKNKNTVTKVDKTHMKRGSKSAYFTLPTVCDKIVEIMEMLSLDKNRVSVSNNTYQKCIDVTIKYFFCSLLRKASERLKSSQLAVKLLSSLCSGNRTVRSMAIRLLVDWALFKHASLFGSIVSSIKSNVETDTSLFELNIKQGFTSQMSQRHLPVYRPGLELYSSKSSELKTEICRQRQRLLLEAIAACCVSDNPDFQALSPEGLTSLSLWLVESVSTDVMYNGLPWPDEEFSKITIERDLHIRRMFKTSPVLWSLLRFVALHRPALCYCSVLLRGLASILIHQWSSWSGKTAPDAVVKELHFTTKNLLEVLALGQLLPPPLNILPEVIHELTTFEISVVLRDCVWLYMKEHVPSPALFRECQIGVFWRDPQVSQAPARFVETLRMVMQKHLPALATQYNQIFIQMETTQISVL